MPKNVLTDAEVRLTGYLSERSILSHSDSLDTMMRKKNVNSLSSPMPSISQLLKLQNFTRKDG
jgi:hypothetical protein